MKPINLIERTPAERELYYMNIALANATLRQEVRRLNNALHKKNYSLGVMRQKLDEQKRLVKLLRGLPPRLVDANGRTAAHPVQLSDEELWSIACAKYPEGNEHLDELMDSENPDMGKV